MFSSELQVSSEQFRKLLQIYFVRIFAKRFRYLYGSNFGFVKFIYLFSHLFNFCCFSWDSSKKHLDGKIKWILTNLQRSYKLIDGMQVKDGFTKHINHFLRVTFIIYPLKFEPSCTSHTVEINIFLHHCSFTSWYWLIIGFIKSIWRFVF